VGTNGTDERVPVQDTIKQRLAKIRAEVSSGLSKEELNKLDLSRDDRARAPRTRYPCSGCHIFYCLCVDWFRVLWRLRLL
jgi:hypothetical protein